MKVCSLYFMVYSGILVNRIFQKNMLFDKIYDKDNQVKTDRVLAILRH